jgi:hypothetical protein
MDSKALSMKDILAATVDSGTARLRCFSRLGVSSPEECDLRGEGVVDFSADRVWMTDRLVTQRIADEKRRESNPLTRPLFWIFFRTVDRIFRGNHEVLFEGGAIRKRKRGANGAWGPPMGSRNQPKYPRHPLCAFAPLAKASLSGSAATRVASHNAGLQCWNVRLTSSAFEPEVWSEITDSEQSVSSIQAKVWFDKKLRVNRLAFEASRQANNSVALWSITELFDFGVDIAENALDLGLPTAAGPKQM